MLRRALASSVRLVQVTVPIGKRETILRALDQEGIDYFVLDEARSEEYDSLVEFPVPTNAVEPVLDELRQAGLGDDAYEIVLDARTVRSRRFERIERRYTDGVMPEGRLSREEIRTRAEELAPKTDQFATMTAISVAVATAGILLDSAAIVVGSMVIAPAVGPAMTTSVGAVLGDRTLFDHGVKLQVFGGLLSVAVATALAVTMKLSFLVPPGLDILAVDQVSERVVPGFLTLIVAMGAGVAGGYSLTSDLSTPLVGVAIAIALIPPLAVIGIGIAWLLPWVVLGSTVLALVNVLSINLGAHGVLWLQGYRPRQPYLAEQARSTTIRHIALLGVGILILSAFLGGVTYLSYQTAAIEEDIRQDVRDVLDRPAYQELTLIEVTVEYEKKVFKRNPERAIITVSHPIGEQYPQLAEDFAAKIATDHPDITVQVQFVPGARVAPGGL